MIFPFCQQLLGGADVNILSLKFTGRIGRLEKLGVIVHNVINMVSTGHVTAQLE